jgi:hypothetical protein
MTSATSNSLCGICQGIIDTIRKPQWHTNLVHHESRESLEESARSYCGICTELLQHLLSTGTLPPTPGSNEMLFPLKCESDTSSASWQSSFELTLTSGGVESFELQFIFEVIKEPESESNLLFELCVIISLRCREDSQIEYTPAENTDSPQSLTLIRHWLKQCTESHARCNASIPEPWAPTRLLDIGTAEDDDIRLVERDESLFGKQPYATLSHCWGRTINKTTTSRNLAQHHERIALPELSKTFRHTIGVAKSLGLRYLWIDSLCIVQDSIADWSHEASLMNKVYRYCYINIAATGASNGSEGCYWERNPAAVTPTEVRVQWSNSKQAITTYHVVPDSQTWARKLINQPLNQRCWVLQERILSPRVLHFGNEQLFWECREFVACETYPRGLPASLRDNTLIDIKHLQLGDELQDDRWPSKYVLQDPQAATWVEGLWYALRTMFQPIVHQEVTMYATMKSSSVYRDWDAIVELYTRQYLTIESDKLEALSGLASSISASELGAPGNGYFAGLWQSSLPAYLLWTTEKAESLKGQQQQRAEHTTPRRYGQYIAPSWSWASIDGNISLSWCQHNYDPKHYLAKLEHAVITPLRHNPFGAVKRGLLRLSAPIATVLWETNNASSLVFPVTGTITKVSPRYLDLNSVLTPPDTSTNPEILFDTMVDFTEELTLLPIVGITKRSAHENEAVIGIVLKQSTDREGFVRIGFFYTMRPQLRRILRNMPRQSVTIF